jgi:hypothetical protein
VAWVLEANDDFTASNGTSLHGRTMSDGTSTWGSPTNGTWEINFNAGNCSGAADACIVATSMTAVGPQRTAAKITHSGLGVVVRHNGTMTNAGATFYGLFIVSSKAGIWRRDAGSSTQLIDYGASSWASGDIMMIEADGDQIKAYRNGSSMGSAQTDSTYTTGVGGMWGGSVGVEFDDFEIYVQEAAIPFFGGIGGVVGGRITTA